MAIGEVGDKMGGDRPRVHCMFKKRTIHFPVTFSVPDKLYKNGIITYDSIMETR